MGMQQNRKVLRLSLFNMRQIKGQIWSTKFEEKKKPEEEKNQKGKE